MGSPGGPTAEEITHGWCNVVYRIRLRDGQQVVLKIAPPGDVAVLTRERNMMRNELAAMALVRDRAGVPVPRVDHADLSRELIDADYFFMGYVDADNFGLAAADGRLTADVIAAGGRQLGALNRELNSIVGPHFGPLEGPGSATWREAFTKMIEDTLADGARVQVDIGWDYDDIRAVLAKNASALEAGLTGIDLPVFGDPTDFMQGYGLGELSEAQRVRRRLYSLYLAVIMIFETKYRGHTDTTTYDLGREQLDLLMAQFGRTR
ncbi:phosphotransferase family protein [Nonomuraea jabiensis]|uniref:Aminoglycoside phosphotransferase domain-containing protein n=1 Tax=Nonomuraea jabiensis TaxID=882448 RepID=A0A7W9GDV0_9ACTN|nr:phosphotransferase [Nonomuraea jabiensis]MBB5781999.1 hypothetical protein [Nonomuraea jabiensis]